MTVRAIGIEVVAGFNPLEKTVQSINSELAKAKYLGHLVIVPNPQMYPLGQRGIILFIDSDEVTASGGQAYEAPPNLSGPERSNS